MIKKFETYNISKRAAYEQLPNTFEECLKKIVGELKDVANQGLTKIDIVSCIHFTVNKGVTNVSSGDIDKLESEDQNLMRRLDLILTYLVVKNMLNDQSILDKYKILINPTFELYWRFSTIIVNETNVEVDIYMNGTFLTKYSFPIAELEHPVSYKITRRFDL